MSWLFDGFWFAGTCVDGLLICCLLVVVIFSGLIWVVLICSFVL